MPWDGTDIRLSLKLDDNQAIEGPDPGARKFFFDIPLMRGDLKVDSEAAAKLATALRNKDKTLTNDEKAIGAGFTQLACLAKALGYLGSADSFDPMAFAERCATGEFDSQNVTYRVYHATDKNGKKYANLGEIGSV